MFKLRTKFKNVSRKKKKKSYQKIHQNDHKMVTFTLKISFLKKIFFKSSGNLEKNEKLTRKFTKITTPKMFKLTSKMKILRKTDFVHV